MKRLGPFWMLVVLAVATYCQDTKPTPTPPSDDVVKISTTLIQVDVTVTDKSGSPIRDLKPGEVQIYENGKLQPITNFSFVAGAKQLPKISKEAEKKATAGLPANMPPPRIRPENIRRTIALVVDDLTLSFGSVVWVRDALRTFVKDQMQEGDLVAIIRTGAGIGALQQFTNDKRVLLAAIDKVKYNMTGSGGTSLFDPISPSIVDLGTSPHSGDTTTRDSIAKNKLAEIEASRAEIFAVGTLGALDFVVRGMGELPGRKSVILMSDGFTIPEHSITNHRSSRLMDPLERLIDLANRSSVVFYTVDARGLVFGMLEAADDVRPGSAVAEARKNTILDTQHSLRYLADETGGIAAINDNNIPHAIGRALDDQSYYLVGYMPSEETFDEKKARYNQIDVKVNRSDVRVRFRSGFFGVTTENLANTEDPTASIIHAVVSPFNSNAITVNMNALFVADTKGGPNVRTFVNVDPKDITFTKMPDGKMKGVFDVYAMTFGDSGAPLDQRYSRSTVLADEQEYKQILERGMLSDFVVPLKKAGAYQVRLAIRDKVTGKVGSASQFVQVPDLGKKRLSVSGAVLTEQPLIVNKNKVPSQASDPKIATSLKRFTRASVLYYDYLVYNAVLDSAQKPNLICQVKLYRDGKVIFQGDELPLDILGVEPGGAVSTRGVLQLGSNLLPGDYILQAEITDRASKTKNNKVDQFVQFEIVE